MSENKVVDCGYAVMAKRVNVDPDMPTIEIYTTTKNPVIFLRKEQVLTFWRLLTEEQIDDISNNDKRKSGKADDAKIPTNSLVIEIGTSGATGRSPATPVSGSADPRPRSATGGDKLQREVPVYTGRDEEFDDPWSRFS